VLGILSFYSILMILLEVLVCEPPVIPPGQFTVKRALFSEIKEWPAVRWLPEREFAFLEREFMFLSVTSSLITRRTKA
jgi:hypothetical protein